VPAGCSRRRSLLEDDQTIQGSRSVVRSLRTNGRTAYVWPSPRRRAGRRSPTAGRSDASLRDADLFGVLRRLNAVVLWLNAMLDRICHVFSMLRLVTPGSVVKCQSGRLGPSEVFWWPASCRSQDLQLYESHECRNVFLSFALA
jgi:hypothetical protein